MKEKDRYTGVVWFPGKENKKEFAIITFSNDDLILETNLCSNNYNYKESIIYGAFTGLNYITFIDCIVIEASQGMISSCIYQPGFSFISSQSLIDIGNINLKEFKVENDALTRWVDTPPYYNHATHKLKLEKTEDIYTIDDKNLSITIIINQNFKLKKRQVLHIKNIGVVSFKSINDISILNAIEIYDQFQKALQFLKGGSNKFTRFFYKCSSSNTWNQVYYNDRNLSKSNNRYVPTRYNEVKDDLPLVLNAIYSNDKFHFCLDKLMENLTSIRISNSRRFLNSIAGYEAYIKNYINLNKLKLNISIDNKKEVFRLISKMKEEEWEVFPAKIVRSRDYYTHSNIGNKDIFSDLELLYISYLFDIVIGYLLLQKINASEILLQKFVLHGNKVYNDSKKVHKNLNYSSLQ